MHGPTQLPPPSPQWIVTKDNSLAAFVAQKLLKDPINQMAAYEYSVTGTWSDPQMAKLDSSQSAELDKSDKAGKK